MNFIDAFLNFIRGGKNSLRWDVVSEKYSYHNIEYKSVADSKREMHEDMQNVMRSFYSNVRKAAKNK